MKTILASAAPLAIPTLMKAIGAAARASAALLARATTAQKNLALRAAASALRAGEAGLLAANAVDRAAAQESGLSIAMLDRCISEHFLDSRYREQWSVVKTVDEILPNLEPR